MEQIAYKLISSLHMKPNHLRGLALELGINHMSIQRRLHDLEEQNVVDYLQKGKNKEYFLKESIEAREYLKMTELQKLIELVKTHPWLRKIIEHIKSKKLPLAIIFGSYAKRNETKNSDIDLYIMTTDKNVKKEIELLDSKLNVKIGEFDNNNALIREMIKNHVIITGVDKYYELIH